jgi:hypothetical protein
VSNLIKSEDDDSDASVNYMLDHPVKTFVRYLLLHFNRNVTAELPRFCGSRCHRLFVSLKDFSGLLSKEDRSVQKLKKKVRSLRMRHSFFHPMARYCE